MRGLTFAVCLLALCVWRSGAEAEEPAEPSVGGAVTVVGHAEYAVRPEIASIATSISSRGETLDEAQRQTEQRMASGQTVLSALAPRGLKVVRQNYYVQDRSPQRAQGSAPTKPDWEATSSYQLAVEPLGDLSAIVGELIAAGFEVHNISFSVKDPRAALLAARKLAARDALEQATAYAEALGVELGEIRSIADGEANPGDNAADLPTRKGGPTISVQVPDTISFDASVQIIWRIGRPSSTPK